MEVGCDYKVGDKFKYHEDEYEILKISETNVETKKDGSNEIGISSKVIFEDDLRRNIIRLLVRTNEEGDMVHHPAHYNTGKYEPIKVIADWGLGFNLGNTIKYISRCEHKGKKIEDLEKAMFYLKYEIDMIKAGK